MSGSLVLNDELLEWLLGEYPLLFCVKFELSGPLCNQLTSLAALTRSPCLRKFHVNFMSAEKLRVESRLLEELSLPCMIRCSDVELACPRLANLTLEASPAMPRSGPLRSLASSLALCADQLNFLSIDFPFQHADEYTFLAALSGKLQNLALRLSSVEVLASLSQLIVLELFCEGQPDLSKLGSWTRLKVSK